MYKIVWLVCFCVAAHLEASIIRHSNSAPVSKLATCQEFVSSTEDCEHFIPVKTIKNYANETYSLYYKFHVFAYTDANFALTNKKSNKDCRIVVGAWGNSRSFIDCYGIQLDKSELNGINSPMFPITISVRLTPSGWLDVSLPGIIEPLVAGNINRANITDFDDGYLCFYSYRQPNRWFYNCCEEEDKGYDFKSKTCQLESERNDVEVTFEERIGFRTA